jgi:hypothetical protein
MNNLFGKEFKNLYKDAINILLDSSGLTVPCTLRYTGINSPIYCNNCIFDSISQLSTNKYNGTGPVSFTEGTICPVCMGMGMMQSNIGTEIVYLACIFDSKHWINWSSKTLNIPDSMVQTICKIELLPKLRNATELVVDNSISKYGNFVYERHGDPELAGLGDNAYIICMWKRK